MPRANDAIIRPATQDDCAAIAGIVRSAFRTHDDLHIPADMPVYHADHHRENMRDPATRWALLEQAGEPVGIVMWRVLPGVAHLDLLFVAAGAQGRGFGSRLLKHHQRVARAEQSDLRIFTLHCLRDSAWALRFYRHQGYAVYEPGDEWQETDLVLYIDACRQRDGKWPMRSDIALLHRRAAR